MKIVNGVLKEIESKDIINGKLIIPEGVTIIKKIKFPFFEIREIALPESLEIIGQGAFSNYSSLKSIVIPKNVKRIEKYAFSDCNSLEKVHILGNVKNMESGAFSFNSKLVSVKFEKAISKIPEFCFEDCFSLTDINMKEGTEVIETCAFSKCRSLKTIKFPSSLKEIQESAFEECTGLENIFFEEGVTTIKKEAFSACTSLKKVSFPESLKTIGSYIFQDCDELEEIDLPKNLETIEKKAFQGIQNLNCIKTPWGNYQDVEIDTKEMIAQYLYLYVNHILKKKYPSFQSFLEEDNISKLLNSNVLYKKDTIIKFKNLFYKLRKEYDISPDLLDGMPKRMTQNFDYKTWRQIKTCLPELENTEFFFASIANMMEVFGLFSKDENTQKRIESFKNLFIKRTYRIEEADFLELLDSDHELEKIKEKSFKRIETTYYILDRSTEIPIDFAIYLKDQLTESDIKKLKKVNGTFGKSLNTFIKEHYLEDRKVEYELLRGNPQEEKMKQYLFTEDTKNTINLYSIVRMFELCDETYNKEFYQFIIDNMDLILRKEYIQSKLSDILKHFEQIRTYYFYQAGIKKVSIRQAIDYVQCSPFNYHDGNYELSELVRKAGVKDQKVFEYYQKIFEENQKRRYRSLIQRSKIYEVNGYTIKAELLRRDDPFAMLVGEKNYANNCQVFNGMGHNCMAHATCSPDGGIFVTRLLEDGKWILLTESWDWKNNNLYCHDNIEGTIALRFGDDQLKKAVAQVLRLDAKELIKESKRQVLEYIEKEKKKLSKMDIGSREKELERLHELEIREPIKLVTCGDKNDDLDIELFFDRTIDVGSLKDGEEQFPFYCKNLHYENFQPVNYNEKEEYFDNFKLAYTDSNQVQYIIAGNIDNIYIDKVSSLEPIHRDERRTIHESGINIRNYTVKKMNDIKEEAYLKEKCDSEIKNAMDFQNSSIYLGEDWYLIYEQEDGILNLSDLAKIKPDIEDEKKVQLQEIISTIYRLINTSNIVEATLKGKKAYSLYLLNKKLGYIEEIKSKDSDIKEDINQEKEYKVYFKKGPKFNK